MNDISFVDTPDVVGMGRIIVDGRYYCLPVDAIKQIAAWKGKAEAGARDTARLDLLDQLNAALNRRYKTVYQWKLILSPNIVRLMSGRHDNGFCGDIDLNDANGGTDAFPSCRGAIDEVQDQPS